MARYVSKEFLSKSADESGSIVCQVETPRQKDIGAHHVLNGVGYIWAKIKINDCSKSVMLDFDCHDQKSYEKRIEKLDKLVEEVQTMRKQYEEMWNSSLRDVAHKARQLEQEAIDKAKAAQDRAGNYRGPR